MQHDKHLVLILVAEVLFQMNPQTLSIGRFHFALSSCGKRSPCKPNLNRTCILGVVCRSHNVGNTSICRIEILCV